MMNGAEVAQFGRALDLTAKVVEGEAEDRVVAGSSPALGTITLSFRDGEDCKRNRLEASHNTFLCLSGKVCFVKCERVFKESENET